MERAGEAEQRIPALIIDGLNEWRSLLFDDYGILAVDGLEHDAVALLDVEVVRGLAVDGPGAQEERADCAGVVLHGYEVLLVGVASAGVCRRIEHRRYEH